MFRPRARALLLAVFVGVFCAACHDSKPTNDTAGEAGRKRASPKANAELENMVAAVAAGKSASVLGVHFSLGNSPTIDQALPVEIAIVPHEGFESLSAYFETQEGLTLISGDHLARQGEVSAEKPIRHQLVVMPRKAGVYVIIASVETENKDASTSRIFSIPVIVGSPAAVPPAPAEAANPAPTTP